MSTSKDMEELAAKVSNDIAEGIDCGESRKVLRAVIAHYADAWSTEVQRRADLEHRLQLFQHAKGLMDVALSTTST